MSWSLERVQIIIMHKNSAGYILPLYTAKCKAWRKKYIKSTMWMADFIIQKYVWIIFLPGMKISYVDSWMKWLHKFVTT